MLAVSFGEKVKELRKSHSMSQERLSELTGLVRGQISKIENGQVNVTLETIYKMSVAFDILMTELVDFEVDTKIKKNYKIHPFVKWAGGKTQLLDKIKELMPKNYNSYFEPFCGAGALFLNLSPKKCAINDFNSELITAYNCFKNEDTFFALIEKLKEHENNHSEEYYYEIRGLDRLGTFNELQNYEIAARFIYLNKACFNGLYRVNANGFFNVPSGKKIEVKAYDKANFDALYNYFSKQKIRITNTDFEVAVKTARKGDFVYFDPPYDSIEDKNSFTSYSKDGFGKDEQLRLSKVYKKLSKKGVFVMLSNHNTEYIKELYKDFNIHIVMARRNINSKGQSRGAVEEVIITNY